MKLQDIYDNTLAAIQSDLDNRYITKNEAKRLQREAKAEFTAAVAEKYDTEEDTYEPVGRMAEYLLGEAERAGYDLYDDSDFQSFVNQVSQSLAITPQDVVGIFSGEITDDVISEHLESLDEDESDDEDEMFTEEEIENMSDEEIAELEAELSELVDLSDYDEALDAIDEDDEEDEELEELKEAAFSAKRELAEFQARQEISSVISQQQKAAYKLVESGDLPPVVYFSLFPCDEDGEELPADETLATFSQYVDQQQVDIATELYAIDKVLAIFSQLGLGQSGLFQNMISQEVAEFESNEDSELDALVEATMADRRRNKKG